jgi:zinc transport system permease protein
LVLGAVFIFYKELFYTTFDETSARAGGIPVEKLNTLLIVLTSVTVVVSLKIVGVLLVSSLLVVPVATSLQVSRSFRGTILTSMVFAVFSVVSGLIISFYFNLAAGGAIVLTSVVIFLIVMIYKNSIG